MQLLIDTNEATLPELSALVTFLETILLTRGANEPLQDIASATSGGEWPRPFAQTEAQRSPAEAFASVPAGTNVLPFPQPPATLTVMQAAPANSFAAPVHTTTQTTVSPAIIAPAVTSVTNAPAVTPPPVPLATPDGERDAAGIPWDARVHSETRKKNADGTWRFRRNLDEAVKAAVLGELRAATAMVAAAASTTSQPLAPASAASNSDPTGGVVPNSSVPLPPPPAVPLPPPSSIRVPDPAESVMVSTPPVNIPMPPIAGTAPASNPIAPPSGGLAPAVGVGNIPAFQRLMPQINKAMGMGTLSMPKVMEAVAAAGLKTISELAQQEAKVHEVALKLGIPL